MDASVNSGVVCLRNLAANLKRDINFDALLTPELEKELDGDPVKGLLKLAAGLQLEPESHNNVTELADTYAGPALVQLQNRNWVCAVNLAQVKQDSMTLFDPLVRGGSR